MPLPAILGVIGTAAGAANSLMKTGLGIGQLFKARQYRNQRPTYQIPDEVGQQLGLRQQLLNARMPGAQQAEQNIQENQAANLYNQQQAVGDSASLLAANASGQGATNRAMRKLAMQEAQDEERRIRGLENAQRTMANYRDKAFKLNELDPYMEDAATRSALIEGGIQNLSTGFADIGAQAGSMYEAESMDNTYSDMLSDIKNMFQQKRMMRMLNNTNQAASQATSFVNPMMGMLMSNNPYQGTY